MQIFIAIEIRNRIRIRMLGHAVDCATGFRSTSMSGLRTAQRHEKRLLTIDLITAFKKTLEL